MTRSQFLRSAAVGLLLSLTAAPILAAGMAMQGGFEGASGHATAGMAEIVMQDGGYVIRLGADFVHDGTAPDATVALGKDGYDESTNLGKLRANEGAQDYALPAGFDPTGYNEVYIWCKKFSVPLGVARLK